MKFESHSEAESARLAWNHLYLFNKPMRVLHMQSKEALEIQMKRPSNLMVKQLPHEMKGEQLDKLFGVYGRIVSSKVGTDLEGNSLQYGYLQYETEEMASACLAAHQHSPTTYLGSPLEVSLFQANNVKEYQTNNLYVKGFPKDMSQEQLEK